MSVPYFWAIFRACGKAWLAAREKSVGKRTVLIFIICGLVHISHDARERPVARTLLWQS
jgi:hypothetical protein